MATKIIKALVDGVIQNIEVEDIVSPEQPLGYDERIDELEEKHEVVITEGNFLVGNGTTELEEITPEEVLTQINGANISLMTEEEFGTLTEGDLNSNTLYLVNDGSEDEELSFDTATEEEIDTIIDSLN